MIPDLDFGCRFKPTDVGDTRLIERLERRLVRFKPTSVGDTLSGSLDRSELSIQTHIRG